MRKITRQKLEQLLQRKDIMVIRHVHNYCGYPKDRWMWQVELNGEIYDWQRKNELIKQAKKNEVDVNSVDPSLE